MHLISQKLEESEAFSEKVLSTLSSRIAVVDNQGKIEFVNSAWENFTLNTRFGSVNKTSVGDNCFEFFGQAISLGDYTAKTALEGIKSVLSGERETFQMEQEFEFRQEKTVFRMFVSLLKSEERKVVIRYIDITERKEIEKNLAEKQSRYYSLVNNSQELMFSCNLYGSFTFFNKKFKESLNYTDEEMHKISMLDIVSEENKDECIRYFEKFLVGKIRREIQCVFITNEGKKIFVEGAGTPLILDGEVTEVQFFFKDVTERKVAETRLIKSKLRYKNLVDNINDAIIIKNTAGKIIYANPKFYDLLGYDDIENLIPNQYVLPKWREDRIEYCRRIANNEIVPSIFEYQAYHKNGSIMWLEDKVSVLIEDGIVSGMQIVVRNITENKNKEQDLKKLIEELTRKNNELVQFNYIVSHNLRAPIANIIGLSNLLQGKSCNLSDEDEIKQHIKSSATKIDGIIKDLNIVLNTKACLNVKREKVFLDVMARSTLDILDAQIREVAPNITIDIHPNANELHSVKSYLESIIYNLFSNAIKYRGKDRTLTVKFISTRIEDKVVMKIEDNGIGIDLKAQGEHIFGLYKRFNFDVEGKGLGLHMIKTQVEALNGKISVESELGKGTRFIIELPV